jgi:putative oxidoreductase
MDATPVDVGLLMLRVGVGIAFSLHGMQKLFGWFGGAGRVRTAAWFASLGFGDGRSAAVLAGMGELLGGLGLALGLVTPLSAAAVAGTMTTAAFVNRHEHGFWSADKGWELNGYLIVVAACLAVAGPGSISLDRALGLTSLPLVGDLLGPGWAGLLLVGSGMVGGWARWATRRRVS